jgi:peptide-methionine (S)-S-oxide reductase
MVSMKTEIVVLGGGCFWCTEAVFRMFSGVVKTTTGYAGGSEPDPTYAEVSTGYTGHAEVLMVEYDPGMINFETILDIFFTMHDPTSLDKQGADEGTQYRSIILYTTEKQKEEAEAFIKNLQKEYRKGIVTELQKLRGFYTAEEYHQKYYDKNPEKPYCRMVIAPKVDKVKKKYHLK